MPTLDVRRLEDRQLATAARIFDDLKHQSMLPFNEANRDPVRQLLDRRLITEVLQLDAALLEPLAMLRDKLCSEPSVHGGKVSRARIA
jgi:hypothetical protein